VFAAAQGVFRGLQDTRTPLYASLLANVINVSAAPVLIFGLHQGVAGAAWATVIGEFVPCALLLAKTASDYSLQPGNLSALKVCVYRYLHTCLP
jgi:Na+-driven multidrug efflux pump